MISKALIMAGGEGTRLRPFTFEIPKPLIKINQKPMIDYVIGYLFDADIEEIYLAINYKKERIKDYLKDRDRISFIETEGSIAYAIIQCAHYIDSPFICVSSDVIQHPKTVKDTCEWFEKLDTSVLHHYSGGGIDNEMIIDYQEFKNLMKRRKLLRTASVYNPEDILSIENKISKNVEGAATLLSETLKINGFDVKYFLSNRRYLSLNTSEELKEAKARIRREI